MLINYSLIGMLIYYLEYEYEMYVRFVAVFANRLDIYSLFEKAEN